MNKLSMNIKHAAGGGTGGATAAPVSNFAKTKAIVAKASDGTSSIRLGDVQVNELLNIYGVINDPLINFGTSIPSVVAAISGRGASATYFKNTITPLIIGDAVYKPMSNPALAKPKTIYINSHIGKQEELTVAEVKTQGLGTWLSTKLSTYLPQIMRTKVRAGYKAIDAIAAEFTIAAPAATENARDYATRVLKELTTIALKMSKTKDLSQGVDTYDMNTITIHVGPEISGEVFAAGLQGNMTEKVFGNGVYNEMQWNGIRIVFSKFLPAGTHAIIGSSFLGKSPMIPGAVYAGPKNLNGVMYEARITALLPGYDKDAATSGFEFIYDNKLADKTKPDFSKDFIIAGKVTLL